MTALRTANVRESSKYTTKIYLSAPREETFRSFYEVPLDSAIKFYGGTIAMGKMELAGYLAPSAVGLESMYDTIFARRTLQQPNKRIEVMQESIATLKPEESSFGSRFADLPAFGIWKDRTESDDELLEELGSGWRGFATEK
ncbi:hypothetical protein ACFLUZ_02700 [Chloroflexota bacterium]